MFLCLIVTGDFNTHLLRLWQNDITNSTSQEIDSLTYQLKINKLLINVSMSKITMSCTDLLFCRNQKTLSNYAVNV